MAEEDILLEEEEAIALNDVKENDTEDDSSASKLADYVMTKFKKSEDYRYEDELRWTIAYRN